MSIGPLPGVVWGALEPQRNETARKALFLDRDGVINVNHGYVHTIERTEWVPGIYELCRAAQAEGYLLVVVTNQAGIARGYYTEDTFRQYARWIHGQFESQGIHLAATYYCPHHPEFGIGEYGCSCDCRKPKPGMILAAAEQLNIDLSASVLLGDQQSDIDAARAAGIGLSWQVNEDLSSCSFWNQLGLSGSLDGN